MRANDALRDEIWWVLTGWFNQRGEVPNIFLIERMVDLIMCKLGRG